MTMVVASGKNGKITEKDELVGAAVKNFVWCAMTEKDTFLKGFYEALPELREDRKIQRMISEIISLQSNGSGVPIDASLEKTIALRRELSVIFGKLTMKQLSYLSGDGIEKVVGFSLVLENLKEKENRRLC